MRRAGVGGHRVRARVQVGRWRSTKSRTAAQCSPCPSTYIVAHGSRPDRCELSRRACIAATRALIVSGSCARSAAGACRVGEIPRACAGGRGIPVDEDPALAQHQIPRREVVVTDEFVTRSGDRRLPDRVGGSDEHRRGVVDAAHERAHAMQLSEAHRAGVDREHAVDELGHLPTGLVAPAGLGSVDALRAERLDEGDDAGGRRRPCLAHGVAD
ncbi:MAG: hypothetical protein K0S49_2406, partial [Microbacterium sp.]|nr:hypothetical protein [Microbacterium sp.]